VIQEFKDGGSIMWFLLACAVAGIALSIERAFTLTLRLRLNVKRFSQQLMETIGKGGVKAGIELCNSTRSPAARVLSAALEKVDQGRPWLRMRSCVPVGANLRSLTGACR